MDWLTVFYWLVVFAVLVLIYWFVIKPRMEQSSSESLDNTVRSNLVQDTNNALANYKPTVGQDNAPEGNAGVTLELKANGELYIRTQSGVNVRLLRGYTITATQRPDSWDCSPIMYIGENLAKTELNQKAQAKNGVRIGFSNLLKPAATVRSA